MTGLLAALAPVLFLTGLFVAAVYLLKYIIRRFVEMK